tara:strand:- start:1047 stop:1583 length:537 start_codon:yes stop_codon:yes gene_type:complete
MKMNNLKNAVRIGHFCRNLSTAKKNLNFVKDSNLPKKDYKKNEARVYFICVNDTIMKIGGSNAKGGIAGTIAPYCSGNGGRPSDRTYGVNYYIEQELRKGNDVEIYAQWMPSATCSVPSLTGIEYMSVSYSYKKMEEACVEEYLTINGNKHPAWNFQEAGMPWPQEIQEGRRKLLESK